MPHLAFCANCGSDRLDVTGNSPAGIQVRCYTCTQATTVPGIILGEVDFLAGAKAKVDAMLERAKQSARGVSGAASTLAPGASRRSRG